MKRLAETGGFALLLVACVFVIVAWRNGPAPKIDAEFMKENSAVMDKMMNAMMVAPSGDVDTDFVNMMEPHHQGAIDMAVLELRFGKNEQLRRIAQEIIVDQQQEIIAMRLVLHRPLPPPTAAPDQVGRTSPPPNMPAK